MVAAAACCTTCSRALSSGSASTSGRPAPTQLLPTIRLTSSPAKQLLHRALTHSSHRQPQACRASRGTYANVKSLPSLQNSTYAYGVAGPGLIVCSATAETLELTSENVEAVLDEV